MSRYTLNMTFMKYKNRENHIQGEVLDIFNPEKQRNYSLVMIFGKFLQKWQIEAEQMQIKNTA